MLSGKLALQYLYAATIAFLQAFINTVFAITADNVKEFADHLKYDVYFADPNCSWQRELNENTNAPLQSKSQALKISHSEVEGVIAKLNDKTPAKSMAEYMVAITA